MNILIDWLSSQREDCISKLTVPETTNSLKIEYIMRSEIYTNILEFIKKNAHLITKIDNLNHSQCADFLTPITNQLDAFQSRLDKLEFELSKKTDCYHYLIKDRVDENQWWCLICNNALKMHRIE